MGNRRSNGILLFCLFLALVLLLAAGQVLAQEDYPIPPGDPDTWLSPGRPEQFVPQGQWTDIPSTGGDPQAYWESETQQALQGLPLEEFFFEQEWEGLQEYLSIP